MQYMYIGRVKGGAIKENIDAICSPSAEFADLRHLFNSLCIKPQQKKSAARDCPVWIQLYYNGSE